MEHRRQPWKVTTLRRLTMVGRFDSRAALVAPLKMNWRHCFPGAGTVPPANAYPPNGCAPTRGGGASKLKVSRTPSTVAAVAATTNRKSGYGHEEPPYSTESHTPMSSRLTGDTTGSLAKKAPSDLSPGALI